MAIVTISRMFGAGGKTLGDMLAKKIGYTFIDNEIIQMVAKDAKVSTNWVESIEREAGGKLQKFLSRVVPKNLVDRVLDNQRGYIDEEIYVETLQKIIVKIADEGDAVILGRGSQYILKNREDTIHLLLVAEKEDRIKFMENTYNLSRSQALQSVQSEDKRRMNLYRKFGRQDYDTPWLYHMVLNMSMIGLEEATDIIKEMLDRRERELKQA